MPKLAVLIAVFITVIVGLAIIPLFADSANRLTETSGGGSTTSTFTSTADFDSGTKSQPVTPDGNFDVETNTDNPGITTGNFEFSSLKGDRFNFADANADTFKWDFRTAQTGGDGTQTGAIAAGVLNIRVIRGAAGTDMAGVTTNTAYTGDVDIRIKLDRVICILSTFRIYIINEELIDDTSSATFDGTMYQFSEATGCSGVSLLSAFTVTNGAFTACGTGSLDPGDPRWLRIARVTNTWTFYHSADGSSWTTDESCSNTVAGSLSFSALAQTGAAPTADASADWDDFHVASGTVGATGFRSAGSWTSASQASSGSSAEVTITYSGASINGFIDYIALYDGATQIAIDNTDRTSGTTAMVTFAVTVPTGWTVRIGLGGTNSATTTMESVSVVVTSSGSAIVTGTLSLLAHVPILFIALAILLFIVAVIFLPIRE